jgi:hypothetical protein
MKIPLLTGAYQARSVIASAQRCVNLYMEKNPPGESFPTTHYPTPGLIRLLTAPQNGWRCLYVGSDNKLYGVVGQFVYLINEDWTLKKLGETGFSSAPCYMIDNGVTVLLVDGSSTGYQFDLGGTNYTTVTNEAFYGSTRVDLIDDFLVLNRPGTRQWYISLFGQVNFDSLDFASKIGASDLLVAVAVTKRNVVLFGEQTTEFWTNTGGNDFPFTRVPGAFLQFGCNAPHSICEADGSLYWLSQSKQGVCMVLRTENYERGRLSTHAIEQEFQSYGRTNDAIGFMHQMDGHYWYVLTFPAARKTWVFDLSTNEWHERAFLNENGTFDRHRANCFASWNGRQIVGDFEDGRLYEMDLDTYTDDGEQIRRVRTFPHMMDDGNRVTYRLFQADMEAGNPSELEPETPPEVRLRFSDTKGKSWGEHISTTVGFRGEFKDIARWHRLGQARDRVFEVSWSADMKTALNGAFIEVTPGAR